MPKTRQQKIKTIESLTGGLKDSKGAVFASFAGLKVADFEELRKQARSENVQVQVAKKTLVKRVFDDLGVSADPKTFAGGVVTLSGADEVTAAKVFGNFAKTHETVSIFGGILEGKFIDAMSVKHLSTLPSKQQLLGQLVGTLNAPVSGFVNVLAGNLRNLVNVLNNIKTAKV
ncbi:MAG: 50S ribosomal protein L10 [Candidatus Magasanikbacteria bacterium]|jgi:large subunit ribosomal protein L10